MKKNKSLSVSLIIFMILFNCIAFFNTTFFRLYELISFYMNISILIVILFIRRKFLKKDLYKYSLLWLFMSFGFFTILITQGGFGSVISPAYSFLLIYILMNTNFDNNQIKLILVTFIILNLYWVTKSNGYYLKFMYNQSEYINSNTIAQVLMYTSIYTKILLKKANFRRMTLFVIINYGLTMWAIINMQSRGAAITLIIFIILDSLIPKKVLLRKKTLLIMLILTIAIGTFFPIVYTNFYMNGVNLTLPIIDKPLYTGRERIWINLFQSMGKDYMKWLFGIGSKVELWDGKNLNVHNNFLAIITNFGLIGYFIYYGILLNVINDLLKNNYITKYHKSLLLVFWVTLVNGFIEVSTVWHIMFFFNFLFVGLYNTDEKKYFVT